jgi:hypothetical protein
MKGAGVVMGLTVNWGKAAAVSLAGKVIYGPGGGRGGPAFKPTVTTFNSASET